MITLVFLKIRGTRFEVLNDKTVIRGNSENDTNTRQTVDEKCVSLTVAIRSTIKLSA